MVASPYREVTNPIIDYVRNIRSESPRDVVTVYIPEYVVGHWWEQILHNQSALRLKGRLLFTPGVMVTSVPYHLASSGKAEQRIERETANENARRSSVHRLAWIRLGYLDVKIAPSRPWRAHECEQLRCKDHPPGW